LGKRIENIIILVRHLDPGVVDLDGNPATWQHSIVEMLACAWLLSLDSE